MNKIILRPLAVFSFVFFIAACVLAELCSIAVAAVVAAVGLAAIIIVYIPRAGKLPTLVSFALVIASLLTLFFCILPQKRCEALVGGRKISGTVERSIYVTCAVADVQIEGESLKLLVSADDRLREGEAHDDIAQFDGDCSDVPARVASWSVVGERGDEEAVPLCNREKLGDERVLRKLLALFVVDLK